MAKVFRASLWIEDGINLFMEYYKYWDDYESSTVLVDAWYNIMAYFDRGTKDIFMVQWELDWNYKFIIANGKKTPIKNNIKYTPIDYKILFNKFRTEINEINNKWWDIKPLTEIITKKANDYNINYFKEIENRINKQ